MNKPMKLLQRSQKYRRLYQKPADVSYEDAMDYPEPEDRRIDLSRRPSE